MNRFKNCKDSLKKCGAESVFVTLLLFLTVLAGILWLIFSPKESFSEDENRALQPVPELSLSSLKDGSFMDTMEDFVGDHFMLREALVSMNTRVQLLMGKRDLASDYSTTPAEGGVYFGGGGHIYEVLLPDRTGTFAANVSALDYFAKKTGMPLYVLPVPSGSQEQPDNLPYSAPNHDQREELGQMKQKLGGNARVIDVFGALDEKTGSDYYFKTDHHWTAYGAYVGYSALVDAMGVPRVPQSDFRFETVAAPFYGTLFSKAMLFGQQPDSFVVPFYKQAADLTQQVGAKVEQGIYRNEYLSRKDKYSVYLGGNPSVCVVRNPQAKGGRLLLLKDSFANSMIPYLSVNFSEIHMIDLRYYNQDIYKYIQQNGIDQVAAVYSIKQLCDVSIANKLSR